LVLSGRANGGQALLQQGVGRVAYNDDLTQATVTFEEGDEPIRLVRPGPNGNLFDPPGSDFGNANAYAGDVFLRSSTASQFFVETNEATADGILGFTTPEDSIPTEGTFDYIPDGPVLPELLLVREGSERGEGFTPVDLDALSLTVDFRTGNVEGRLFRNQAFVEDTVALTVTLENGRLEGDVVRGELRLSATLGPSDRELTDMFRLTVTSSNLVGRFYGGNAESLGIVYSGEGTVEVDGETIPIVFGGVSLADR
jgi:hypothetical protein